MLEVPRRWEWETRETPLPVPLRSAFPIDETDNSGAGLDRAGFAVAQKPLGAGGATGERKEPADAAIGDRDRARRSLGGGSRGRRKRCW